MPGRILVVEDEPDIRLLLRMVLEGNGYSVVEAADTRGALDEDALRSAYGGIAAVLHRPVLEPDLLRGVARALCSDWPAGGAYPMLSSSHG